MAAALAVSFGLIGDAGFSGGRGRGGSSGEFLGTW